MIAELLVAGLGLTARRSAEIQLGSAADLAAIERTLCYARQHFAALRDLEHLAAMQAGNVAYLKVLQELDPDAPD